MFEDVCLVCGRIADGLYCSDVCRDADAVQLPPSSIDHAIDLGFITDSIPPLVSSARPPRNPEDPSAVSSPTSSILTTPSVLDELDTENSDHHLTPATNGIHQKGHDPSTITGAATTMTSAGTTVLDSLLLPPTIQKAQPSPTSPVPHFHLPHPQTQPQTQQQQQQPQQQIRSPRLQPTAGAPLLPFARRPGNTNIHTPPPSTQPQHHSSHLHAHPNQSGSSSSSRVGGGGSHHHHHHHHRRTASFNPASGVPPSAGVNPGGGAGTPGPILGGAGAGHASPFSPPSRGASGSTGPTTPGLLSVHHHHHHSSCSSHSHSRCSTSGHPSPALSPLRVADDNNSNSGTIDRAKLLANLEELDLDGARGDRRRRPVVQAAPNHQQQHHHHHHPAAQAQEDHDALERARKRRARASLPAYFSNLVMGVAGVHTSSSKVPSTAVSSGTSSSDEQHKQQRQQQQRQQKIRHVRSKSAMRASDRSAAKLSTSASTFKVGGGVVGPTRSNSDGSVAERTSQAQSPTTPTVLTRNGSRNQLLAFFNSSVTTTSTMTKDGRDNISPPPRGRDREKVRGRVRGINTSVGAVAMTPSVEAIVSPITATRHSMTPPGVLINHDGTTAGGMSPASYAEKHIRFIASSVANGSNLGSRTRMLAALQGHLRSPPPPPASASLSGGKSGLSDQSPSSPIAIRPSLSGSSSSGRPPLSAGILEESVEVPFVVPAGSNYTRALAPRLHHRLGGGVGVGGRVNALTMSPKSRRYSSPTTSTAGIGAGLHVPIALMMSPAIERPAKPTAIPGANQDKETSSTAVFGRGGRRNSRREEEMSPPRPVVRRGWSPVRGRGAAAVFDDDDDEEEEEEDEDEEKEENDDADEEEVEEEEEEEEEPQRGRSRSRMRSRSRARSRSLERERRGHRRSFGVAGY